MISDKLKYLYEEKSRLSLKAQNLGMTNTFGKTSEELIQLNVDYRLALQESEEASRKYEEALKDKSI